MPTDYPNSDDYIMLNWFGMPTPGHMAPGAWKSPKFHHDNYNDIDYHVELAQRLERGKFDCMFWANVNGMYDVYGRSDPDVDPLDNSIRHMAQVPKNDPLLYIPQQAYATENIGFAITYATTYHEPYRTARQMSTLDHLTDGRIAWNVVTSYLEHAAKNMGLDERPEHDERYEVADEYMEILYKLWMNSWEDDAVVKDTETDTYTDPDKVHRIDHESEHFDVPGPHLAEPSPQRTPLLFQAGQSPRGREFAARHAEVVFTIHPTPATAKKYADDMRSRVADHGRDPESLKIITGLTPIVGVTEAEAHEKAEFAREHVSIEGALSLIGGWTDIDFSDRDLDDSISGEYDSGAISGLVDAWVQSEPNKDWTVRDLAEFIGMGGFGYPVIGNPEQVADELIRWVEEGTMDGFNIFPLYPPSQYEDFIDLVVPILQERGYHKEEYGEGTIRERLLGGGAYPEENHVANSFDIP